MGKEAGRLMAQTSEEVMKDLLEKATPLNNPYEFVWLSGESSGLFSDFREDFLTYFELYAVLQS